MLARCRYSLSGPPFTATWSTHSLAGSVGVRNTLVKMQTVKLHGILARVTRLLHPRKFRSALSTHWVSVAPVPITSFYAADIVANKREKLAGGFPESEECRLKYALKLSAWDLARA